MLCVCVHWQTQQEKQQEMQQQQQQAIHGLLTQILDQQARARCMTSFHTYPPSYHHS